MRPQRFVRSYRATASAAGVGQVDVLPASNNDWVIAQATVSTTGTRQPTADLYVGGTTDASRIDGTYTGAKDTAYNVGTLTPGTPLTCVWTGANPGDVLTLRLTIVQYEAGRAPPDPAYQPFTNSVVGGTTLVRTAIQSPGYTPGVSGWSINADGSVDLNSGTFRGPVLLGAAPNPRIAIGPAIPAELVAFGVANNVTFSQVVLYYTNNTDYRWEATGTFVAVPCYFTGTYDTVNGVFIISRVLNQGAGSIDQSFGSLALNTFQLSVRLLNASFQVFAANSDGIDVAGNVLTAIIGGGNETWHAFPYANGWSDNAGGFRHLMYRRTALHEIQIIGTAKSPNPFNATVGTLPIGWRPVDTQPMWASTNAGTDQLLTVDLNGVVSAFGSTVINVPWFINGTITLDT
jgi:hypothetical protein